MVSTPICVSPQTLSHSSISPLLPSPIYPHFLTLIVSIFSCPCCPWEGKMTPSVRLIIARHHRTRASLLYLQTKMKTNGPRCWCTLGLWGKKKKKGGEWDVQRLFVFPVPVCGDSASSSSQLTSGPSPCCQDQLVAPRLRYQRTPVTTLHVSRGKALNRCRCITFDAFCVYGPVVWFMQ